MLTHISSLSPDSADSCSKNLKSRDINLGTGLGTSVLELVKTFEDVNNLRIDYEFTDRRKGDKAIVYADPSFAKSILKWEAKRNVVEMCKDGWNWQKNYPNGY